MSSFQDAPVVDAIRRAATPVSRTVTVDGADVTIPRPFPSPAEWRDQWIYFLMVDRFNNPAAPPAAAWDSPFGKFQGGTFEGIRQQLGYLRDLGAGAIWLSPVLKNRPSDEFAHHGYGIQDFLRVEPRFATAPGREEAELESLVDEAHARGMYVIFDVVLNHVGDLFEYDGHGGTAPFRDSPYPIRWRDETGAGRSDWPEAEHIPGPPEDGVVWPREFQHNAFFRRQGKGGEGGGDFESLKELVTAHRDADGRYAVRDRLIQAFQYVVARFDIDGIRIDTLKYIERDFARTFGNAMREYALSIGKRNFFSFGEVFDGEERVAQFIGRNTLEGGDMIGVDAALDFPLYFKLPGAVKAFSPPGDVVGVFENRKRVQRHLLSSHGDASRHFVTFLDNHDLHQRFRHADGLGPAEFDDQVSLGLGLLFTLQGIPCVYYGTEQGLHGAGNRPEAVREALWGKPAPAFDRDNRFYTDIRRLAEHRRHEPALRYGRQYFRPVSGDGVHFGVSPFPGGVLAFSRILFNREVVVVANTNTTDPWTGHVVVDRSINRTGAQYRVLEPTGVAPPDEVVERGSDLEIHEVDGSITHGPARTMRVDVQPQQLQILVPD